MWHEQCGLVGVLLLYKHGKKLVGDHYAKSRLLRVQVSDSEFPDDLAPHAVACTTLESTGRKFVQVGSYFGLTVSIPKTYGLAMGAVMSERDFFFVRWSD